MSNKSGFTLLEVLMALFLLTGCLGIIVGIQQRSVQQLMRERAITDHLIYVKKEWFKHYIDQPTDLSEPKKINATQENNTKDQSCITTIAKPQHPLRPSLEKTNEPERDTLRMIATQATWEVNKKESSIGIVGVLFHLPEER